LAYQVETLGAYGGLPLSVGYAGTDETKTGGEF